MEGMPPPEDLMHRFRHHPPRSQRRVRDHEAVRQRLGEMAEWLHGLLPPGRENALVLTKVEEAMFWANAALARAPDPDAEAYATGAGLEQRG